VTPDNVGHLGVGDLDGEVTAEAPEAGGFVRVKLAIRRADAIQAVKGGKTELSPGYVTLLDPTPGVDPEFGPYDAVQRDRRYNHLAIVDVARGGPEIRLRADGARTQYHRQRHREDSTMNPTLIALLSLLGVTRFDDEAAAIREGADLARGFAGRADAGDAIVEANKATAQKHRRTVDGYRKALRKIKAADGSDLATKLAPIFARLDAEEDPPEEEKVDGLGQVSELLGMAMEALAALQSENERLEGENATIKSELDEIEEGKAAEAEKADRAQLARLVQAHKIDGIDLATEGATAVKTADARLAVAKHLVPTTRDDASEDYQRGVIGVALTRLDSKATATNRDAWDPKTKKADAADQTGADPKPTNPDDAFFARADAAIAGGEEKTR
jgi:hypothetical protein